MDLFQNQYSESESDFSESTTNNTIYSNIQNESYDNRLYSTDVVMPNIFVTIPINSNTNNRLQNQLSSNNNSNEIKSEPIKLEFSDNSGISSQAKESRFSDQKYNNNNNNKKQDDSRKNNCSDLPLPSSSSSLVTARPKSLIKCYKCAICPFISISQTALNTHRISAHKKLTDNNFTRKLSCPGCENVFYTKKSLETHLLNDHQMDSSEIELLISSLCDEEIMNTDNLQKKTKSKSRIYIKNVKILQKPNFLNENNRDKKPVPSTTVTSLPLSFDSSQMMLNDAMSLLMEDSLMISPQNSHQIESRKNKNKIFIKNVNILKEPSLLDNNVEIDNSTFRRDQDFYRDNFIQLNNSYDDPDDVFLNDDDDLTIETNKNEMISTKPKSKIYIKNVDILKNPIVLDSTSNMNVFQETTTTNVNIDLTTNNYSDLPHFNFVQIQNNYELETANNIDSENYIIDVHSNSSNSYQHSPALSTTTTDPDHLQHTTNIDFLHETQKSAGNKIFIKNVNILKETKPDDAVRDNHSHENGLHLRTVDELNLLNINDVQSYMVPIDLEQIHSKTETNEKNRFQPFKTSDCHKSQSNDEVVVLDEYNDFPELIISNGLTLDTNDDRNFHDIVTSYDNLNRFQQSRILDVTDLLCQPNKSINTNSLDDYNNQPTNEFVIVQSVECESTEQRFSSDCQMKTMKNTEINDVQHENNENIQTDHYYFHNSPNLPIEGIQQNILTTENHHNINTNTNNNNNNTEADEDVQLVSNKNIQNSNEEIQKSDGILEDQYNLIDDQLSIQQNPIIDFENPNKNNEIELQISENTFGSNYSDNIIYDYKSGNNTNELIHNPVDAIIESIPKKYKNRGRPKGVKQTGNSKIKKMNPNLKTKEISYKCDYTECSMRFRSNDIIIYHKKCHGIDITDILCPECKQIDFGNWNVLHTHLWRKHKIDMELFSCKICTFKTPILSRLNNTHIKIHSDERNFKCDQCCKAFKNTKQLKNHRRIHRQSDICFKKCNECSATFSKSSSLKMHVENVHQGKEDYRCIYCDKTASTKSGIKMHILTHLDEKRFKCDKEKCSYATNDHNAFRRHKMIHTKTKNANYNCPYCKYTSIQSTTFRNHILKSHPEKASEIIFQCQKCSYVTINKLKFELHQLKHSFDDEKRIDSLNIISDINPVNLQIDNILEDVRESDGINISNIINDKEKDEACNLPEIMLCQSNLEHHQQTTPRPAIFVNNFSNIENFGQRSKILELTDKMETIPYHTINMNNELQQLTDLHHQNNLDACDDVCFNIDLT